MNEIRDLIIGIDIGKEYTQICYYDRKAEEARSLYWIIFSHHIRAYHLGCGGGCAYK